MRVYKLDPAGRRSFVYGPADLDGSERSLVVTGGIDNEREPARWATALGLAIVRGASVRREP